MAKQYEEMSAKTQGVHYHQGKPQGRMKAKTSKQDSTFTMRKTVSQQSLCIKHKHGIKPLRTTLSSLSV